MMVSGFTVFGGRVVCCVFFPAWEYTPYGDSCGQFQIELR